MRRPVPKSGRDKKLAAPKPARSGRADRCDLAERAAHASFELKEIAWLNLSFLRLRAGALWEEAEGAGGRFFGFEGHAFLR